MRAINRIRKRNRLAIFGYYRSVARNTYGDEGGVSDIIPTQHC